MGPNDRVAQYLPVMAHVSPLAAAGQIMGSTTYSSSDVPCYALPQVLLVQLLIGVKHHQPCNHFTPGMGLKYRHAAWRSGTVAWHVNNQSVRLAALRTSLCNSCFVIHGHARQLLNASHLHTVCMISARLVDASTNIGIRATQL